MDGENFNRMPYLLSNTSTQLISLHELISTDLNYYICQLYSYTAFIHMCKYFIHSARCLRRRFRHSKMKNPVFLVVFQRISRLRITQISYKRRSDSILHFIHKTPKCGTANSSTGFLNCDTRVVAESFVAVRIQSFVRFIRIRKTSAKFSRFSCCDWILQMFLKLLIRPTNYE